MPCPAWGFDFQEAVTPQPAWGSAPGPGDAWLSGVATVLDRINFKDSRLRKSTHENRKKPISVGTMSSISSNSGAQ